MQKGKTLTLTHLAPVDGVTSKHQHDRLVDAQDRFKGGKGCQ